MAGKDKYAQRMGEHVGMPIDAACPVNQIGTAGMQMGGAIGGAIGAAVTSGGSRNQPSDVAFGQFAWLGVGPTSFTICKSSAMGKPTGDPLAQANFADVTGIGLSETKLTLRADLDLADGRHLAFETKRRGNGKASVEVMELLRDRCQRSG